jgi:hypothetical protein
VPRGSSLTQHGADCLAANSCGVYAPIGVTGPGSCIGGTPLSLLGGCAPGSGSGGSPGGGGGSGGGTGGGGGGGASAAGSGGGGSGPTVADLVRGRGGGTPSETRGSGVAAARAGRTPFTGAMTHPLPWLAISLAMAGALLALCALSDWKPIGPLNPGAKRKVLR